MIIRKAMPADSDALIALTASSPMEGTVSLRIDRKPDFFNLLHERGDHMVMVAEDANGYLVGSFSAAKQYFVIDGNLQPVYYLGDLKVHSRYRHSTVAYRLVKAMQQQVAKQDVKLFLCTAAEGNNPVSSFFKGRAGLPIFRHTSSFNVLQMLPKKSVPDDNIQFNIDQAKLESFYLNNYQLYHFHPPIDRLEACENICFIKHEEITSAISLYDPVKLKQNVIVNYPFSVSLALSVLHTLKYFIDMPSLPKKGTTLKLLYVKFAAYKPGYERQWLALLRHARHLAHVRGYHFLTMAVDAKHQELLNMVRPYSQFNFRSLQFMASMDSSNNLIAEIEKHLSHEDYSLV